MDKKIKEQLFNTPLEIGLRLLFILKNTSKNNLNLQRLIYYNYLIVHTSDISSEQESLHPDLPNRSCEILIGIKIIKQGLYLIISKGLIDVKYTKTGIKYLKNKFTINFLSNLTTDYAKHLDKQSDWVCKTFEAMNDKTLNTFIQSNLGKWGGEFSREFHLVGEKNA